MREKRFVFVASMRCRDPADITLCFDLYPRASMPPLYNTVSGGKIPSAGSGRCFLTSDINCLSLSSPCCPEAETYPCFITTPPGEEVRVREVE